ncbi:PQQ-dependent dehydrogenase, methanol/ethanol family [Sphingosinicella rhizophila]|uniref:PQQ-dependent dehydrogenase, methanol/ethanol family n=1 Tax=Sphingosinicella rhizophila TaxID=3050082 RepID=A0ABU3Q1R8_9SPHN|nr:PQQ-dependent dehydrogenase, methanol/ethanol family [Sphingosinicella sp. GR2756]MDT9597366.1 PQQ-dependent dehydrogenase, methanol/ethanol family [Sphingosinicella sp. GR2756]
MALALQGCGPGSGKSDGPAAVDQARLLAAAQEPGNWLTYGGGFDAQHFSPLDQINTGNVGQLGLAWSFEFDTNRGQEATPLVVDGVLYTSTAWSKVYAIDGRTGKELWKFDPEVAGEDAYKACCDVVNRGVAVWKGKVFVGAIDGRLIALDAATGKQLWSVQTVDKSKPYTITGAPRVFKDKVIIGNSGAEFGVRGYVTAYDTETGKLAWRFYTVPGDPAKGPDGAASDPAMRMAARTWAGKWYEYGGGGTVWDSIVYDPEFDQVYIGVGNGAPWNRKVRSDGKGDNLFLASIVAVDADTGKYKWHYQTSPGDSWDYTATQPIMLATLPIGGQQRKVLMQAPKNGFFYVIDRANGKLLSAKPFVEQSWVERIDMATGRPVMSANAYYEEGVKMITPSSVGGHNWQPMSYSPRTGLVYIPTVRWSLTFDQDPAFRFRPGPEMNQGAKIGINPKEPVGTGALIAWDPIKQREVWRVPQPEMINGGTVATAGDLVFAGNAHGEFSAFDARSGKKLWSFSQPTGILAGPVSYSIDGVQYIAVLVGKGGGAMGMPDVNRPRIPRFNGRMLVFKLGGKASLPKLDLTLPPANPPKDSFTSAQIEAGAGLYVDKCARCHEGQAAPDLRRSGALADRDVWKSIVIDGVMSGTGMIGFSRWMNEEQAESIRGFVGMMATELAKQEKDAPPKGASAEDLSRVKPQ